jgi:hypothetical protein
MIDARGALGCISVSRFHPYVNVSAAVRVVLERWYTHQAHRQLMIPPNVTVLPSLPHLVQALQLFDTPTALRLRDQDVHVWLAARHLAAELRGDADPV